MQSSSSEQINQQLRGVTFNNLFNNTQKLANRPAIQGHRGGFDPGNTLEGFKKAIEAGITSIELDVWLSSDDKLVVIHGGDDGEFHHAGEEISANSTDASSSDDSTNYQAKKQLVFESTYDEICEGFKGQSIPTLDEVFDLAGDRLFVNIECKLPHDLEIKKLYNYKSAACKVFDLIKQYDFGERCYVSSFDICLLEEIVTLQEKSGYIVRTALVGPWDLSEELPSMEYLTNMPFIGYNCEYTRISPELVQTMKKAGKLLGSWFDKPIYVEDDEAKEHLFQLDVDMVCTDYPLQTLNLLRNYSDLKPESIRKWSADLPCDNSPLEISI